MAYENDKTEVWGGGGGGNLGIFGREYRRV